MRTSTASKLFEEATGNDGDEAGDWNEEENGETLGSGGGEQGGNFLDMIKGFNVNKLKNKAERKLKETKAARKPEPL